jgi:surfactin synthase thioesterase subunit
MIADVSRVGQLGLRTWTSGGPRWLVCLPPAGGTSGWFGRLADALDPQWTVVGVDPPGHGPAGGTPYTDVGRIAEAVSDGLARWAVPPHVLLGHSVGGMTALRVAASGRTPVTGLVVCATPPPDAAHELGPQIDPTLSDADMLAALAPLGRVPDPVRRAPRLIDRLVPALRADLIAYAAEVAQWQLERRGPAIGVPTLVVGAAADPIVPVGVLERWAASVPHARVELVSGGHFFPQDDPVPLARMLDDMYDLTHDGASV